MENKTLILASKSPRRKELLQNIYPNFIIKTKEIEEVYPKHLTVEEVPKYLSKLKADAFKTDLNDNEVILTSDTIVCLNSKIYGKPKNKEEAIQFLEELSGKTHQVITGICLRSTKKEHVFSETTLVSFKNLSNQEIEYYIDNYQPYDKAGAYAIQEWIGMIGIEKIVGDYFNVVGLPLFKLNKALKNF